MALQDYRAIADVLAGEISAGRIKPGERLPPQRDFAYRRGIAVSTASRVYAELGRRGLVTGEVGRGTFVRSGPEPASTMGEPPTAPIDLALNFSLPAQPNADLAAAIERVLRADALTQALTPLGARGTRRAREVAARFLARPGWSPSPASMVFTGNGRQAIAAAFAALAPPGERIGVEALTYPIVKGLAARLGITLVPLPLDGEGLRPDALADAARGGGLSAVYLQPSLHNPLGPTMGAARRAEIAAVLRSGGLVAIEDAVFSFLLDETPLAAFAPEQTILIDSLSKRLAPGVTLGFLSAPDRLVDRIAGAARSGAWTATALPLAIAVETMADGIAARIGETKRADAAARQRLAREALAGLSVRTDPRAYHLWLELPEPWRAESYMAAAARRGIALAPASAFAVTPGHAPNAVRIALAAPRLDQLESALDALRRIALSDPSETDLD